MRKLILTLVGSLAASAAQAADLPVYFEPVGYDQAVAIAPSRSGGVDWNSYFVGASGLLSAADPLSLGADVFVGVTATANDFLYGGVLSAGYLSGDGGSAYFELASRFGIVVDDNIAAFAIVGGGYETLYDDGYAVLGGGVSMAVADDLTVEATLKAHRLNGAPAGDEWRLVGGVGLAFHF